MATQTIYIGQDADKRLWVGTSLSALESRIHEECGGQLGRKHPLAYTYFADGARLAFKWCWTWHEAPKHTNLITVTRKEI